MELSIVQWQGNFAYFALRFLFSRRAATSFDKQLYLMELVGEEDWHFNLASGLLSFGQHLHFQAQVLGTESDHDHTWLWAWANEGSNIPFSLLQCALQLKALGEKQQIPELTTPMLQLGDIDGHTLAMLASGVCQANAYYRCPYEGGAAFVLIQDESFPKPTEPPLARIASVFPQAISSIDIPDHRLALIGHLDHHGLVYEEVVGQVLVKENGEPVLTAVFDEQNRLTNLEVQVQAATR
ncbi:MAG: hypothetical protein JNM56_28350 [Planctomycetia bacterium]|nr:hypothetical protein [Planctomycetia bacterium]